MGEPMVLLPVLLQPPSPWLPFLQAMWPIPPVPNFLNSASQPLRDSALSISNPCPGSDDTQRKKKKEKSSQPGFATTLVTSGWPRTRNHPSASCVNPQKQRGRVQVWPGRGMEEGEHRAQPKYVLSVQGDASRLLTDPFY